MTGSRASGFGLGCVIALAGLAAGAGDAAAQSLHFRITASSNTFTPLHSYVSGEIGEDVMFFCGISGLGLHAAPQNGSQIGFPTNIFSREVHLFDQSTGQLYTSSTAHLSPALREALTVTNPTATQYGSTLYIFGGYGPVNTDDDWTTRDTLTYVDLAQVRTALKAGLPVPEAAFTVEASAEAQVAGARCVRMSGKCALIGGAKFTGDYGRAATAQFLEEYAIKTRIYDVSTSWTAAETTFVQTGGIPSADRLRRRDMNALPATLPATGGGVAPGFAVLGGVFRSGFFAWENPLTFAVGDADITNHLGFTQRMNQYETPAASFYSASADQNRFVLFSGLSSHTWNGVSFVPVGGGQFGIPWTSEITEITMTAGVFQEERVLGQMPLPMVNGELELNPLLPHTSDGQLLLDELPANEVLLGRIFGGLRAAATGPTPPTFASNAINDVYVVFGVRGDISRDGVVNANDLAMMLGAWGTSQTVPDLNLDGVVNSADLALLLGLWGNTTPG